jgi:hypothetical protein
MYETKPCGCTVKPHSIKPGSYYGFEYQVSFCPLHAVAGDLYKAAQEALGCIAVIASHEDIERYPAIMTIVANIALTLDRIERENIVRPALH